MPVFPVRYTERTPSDQPQSKPSGWLPDIGAGDVAKAITTAGKQVEKVGWEIFKAEVRKKEKAEEDAAKEERNRLQAEHEHMIEFRLSLREKQLALAMQGTMDDEPAVGPEDSIIPDTDEFDELEQGIGAAPVGLPALAAPPIGEGGGGVDLEDLPDLPDLLMAGGPTTRPSAATQPAEPVQPAWQPPRWKPSAAFVQFAKDAIAGAKTREERLMAAEAMLGMVKMEKAEFFRQQGGERKAIYTIQLERALASGAMTTAKSIYAGAVANKVITRAEGVDGIQNLRFHSGMAAIRSRRASDPRGALAIAELWAKDPAPDAKRGNEIHELVTGLRSDVEALGRAAVHAKDAAQSALVVDI